MKIILDNAPEELHKAVASHGIETSPVDFPYNDSPESRWHQMVLASQGVRLWSNTPSPESPLYAGPLPVNDETLKPMLVEYNFVQLQREYFESFGVTYIGRIDLNPRYVVLTSHKKAGERHTEVLSDDLRDLLTGLTDDWWGALGIVSTGSVDKLETFIDAMPDIVPIAYTTASASKLKYAGWDFVYADTPRPDKRYGIEIRERVSRFTASNIIQKNK